MTNVSNFKPNLIPNSPKDGSFDIYKKIEENWGYCKYLILPKKDGCRLQLKEEILTGSLKKPKSKLVLERFEPLRKMFEELNIIADGEFYAHGMKFNEIFRFFSNEDVTRPEVKLKLEKLKAKDPKAFFSEYGDRSIEWLTTFHEELKFWLFDGIVLDRPDLVRYQDRIVEIIKRVLRYEIVNGSTFSTLVIPTFYKVFTKEQLNNLYEEKLGSGYEGLVLTHIDHEYKFGRNTLKEGTILKMKDDSVEYDGIVLEVEEATVVKEGVEKTINELGRSVTSKKKEDREPSGKAKGFVVEFNGLGTFTVQLQGFNDDQKAEIWKNKEAYIGRHFKYTGMPPVKDFPRSAFFDCWRDEK